MFGFTLALFLAAILRTFITSLSFSKHIRRRELSRLVVTGASSNHLEFTSAPAETRIKAQQDTLRSTLQLAPTQTVFCGGHVEPKTNIKVPISGASLCKSTTSSLGKVPEYKFKLLGDPDMRAGGRREPTVVLEMIRNSVVACAHSSMDCEPDISIVMPVYNAAPALKQSIPALFSTTTESWEFTLILDACYDNSFDVAKKFIKQHFESSTCVRARIIKQPTAIWEVSCDNLGMRTTHPKHAYILFQADNIVTEIGWNEKMLKTMLSNRRIFGISGRCGHSWDLSHKIGRCGEDIAEPLSSRELQMRFRVTDTVNRGPLMYRASVMMKLQFLDEIRFLLDDDDHDLNKRAKGAGYIVGYLPLGSYAPLHLSAKRNPEYRMYTPAAEVKKEQAYKQFRLNWSNELN